VRVTGSETRPAAPTITSNAFRFRCSVQRGAVVTETFDLGPTRLRVLAATTEATVLEAEIEPGGGSTWHTHTKEDETLLVLEGELVLDDGERHVLLTGDAHVLPRGRRHAFANESDAPARACFFCSPGGLEHFFRAIASGVPADEAATRAGLHFE
jgi:quercetin dioxygenase-like cupin family protein